MEGRERGDQCDQALEAVLAALSQLGELRSAEDAAAALSVVQQACTALTTVTTTADGQHIQLQAVLASLARLSKVLQALDACLAAVEVPPAYDDTLWSSSVLPLADALLYSRRWNETIARQGEFGKQLQEGGKSFVRDAVIPVLQSVAAKCPPAEPLPLAGMYGRLLQMGTTAAALVGYQSTPPAELDGRTGLAPYATLNVLWHGITRLWAASPQAVRRRLLDQGMGVGHLLKMLCSYLSQDVEALAAREDPNVPKRMQFWLGIVNKLAVACPEASSTAWEALLKWQVQARQRLASLGEGHAAYLVAEAELFCKSAKCLAIILNHITSEDSLKVSVDRLRARVAAAAEPGDPQAAATAALPTLLVALDVLQWGGLMKPRVRLACLALVSDVVEGLAAPLAAAAALQQPEVPVRVAEGVLAFLAAACSACGNDNEGRDVWLRAQRQLFLLALHPHPLITEVLAHCWGDLIRLADSATTQQHLAVLHQLLHAAAAAEGHGESALTAQLTSLLSCLLCATSPGAAEKFLHAALQVPPASLKHANQLCCLSADLRTATLVGAASGSTACAPTVGAVLQQLAAALHEIAAGSQASLQQLAQQPADSPDVAAFVRLVECIQHATAFFCSSGSSSSSGTGEDNNSSGALLAPGGGEILQMLASNLALACTVPAGAGPLPWASPALRALHNLSRLAPHSLGHAQLEALLPALERFQQEPETAAQAAALAAAYSLGSVVPTSLFHAILSEEDPVLRFAAMESYLSYVRKCDPSLVHGLLPPAMRDPDTGAMAREHSATAAQHLSRRWEGGSQLAGPMQLRSWAEALQGIAGGAAAQVAAAARVQAQGAGVAALDGAARALCTAMEQLEAVAGEQVGPLDAGTAELLRQCSARLAALVEAAGG